MKVSELVNAPQWLREAGVEDEDVEIISGIGVVWHSGTWKCGSWGGGVWKDGIWERGTWQDGVWANGTWMDGTWQDGIWMDGIWMLGIWKDGIWENGIWLGGTWKDGIWVGGVMEHHTQEFLALLNRQWSHFGLPPIRERSPEEKAKKEAREIELLRKLEKKYADRTAAKNTDRASHTGE